MEVPYAFPEGTVGNAKLGISIIAVIHYADDAQSLRNAARAFDAGCQGVMLIHMQGRNMLLPPIARAIKVRWPDRLVGINHLGRDPARAVDANIADGLDMTWTDEQLTHSQAAPWDEADEVRKAASREPGHVVFTGVAFKHQADEPDPGTAALKAISFGFVPTTSGSATGVAADTGRISALRTAIGREGALAIASGITPDNVGDFAPHLTHILVATGISSDFHEFDPSLIEALVERTTANADHS